MSSMYTWTFLSTPSSSFPLVPTTSHLPLPHSHFPPFTSYSPLSPLLSLAAHCFVSIHIRWLEFSPLDYHFPLPPLHLCFFFIYLRFVVFSSSYLVSLRSFPFSLFLSCFSLACRFHLSSLHALNSIDSFTSSTPLHPSFFSSLPCISVEETTVTPNPVACHVLPHPSPRHPHCPRFRILPVLAAVVWHPFTCSPSPTQFPFLCLMHTRASTTAYKYPIRNTMMLFLAYIRFVCFPFVNPYRVEGVNQVTPDRLEGVAHRVVPPRSTELSSMSAGLAID